MWSKVKLAKFINDNIVLLVGLPLIFGIHYGWSKLQEIPDLVDQSKKKEIPIVGAYKAFKNKTMEKINSLTGNSSRTEPQEEK